MTRSRSSLPPALRRSPAWRRMMNFYRMLKPGLCLMKLPGVGAWLQKVLIPENGDANWFLPNQLAAPPTRRIQVGEALPAGKQQALPGIVVEHLLDTARIPTTIGRHLSRMEASQHLQQGLMPTILYNPSEARIFGVSETGLLSICFCCDCCCDVRLMLRRAPDRYWDLYNHRLPGGWPWQSAMLARAAVHVCRLVMEWSA